MLSILGLLLFIFGVIVLIVGLINVFRKSKSAPFFLGGIILFAAGSVLLYIVGSTAENKKTKTSSSETQRTFSSESINGNSSTVENTQNSSQSYEQKKTIDLTSHSDYQFTGMANIKPTKAIVDSGKLTFYFDWRNDDGIADERSFNGSGVTIVLYQNGVELPQLDDSYSGTAQYIEKNTSLEINYDYSLIDESPVTVKMLPLEGEEQEFTFEI
ncbi:hypothetical protein [uncultured Enterococcus sp.]|uniref:hypothetical protein n=1 Tax=uncultured Enterococcus sp. TaxID=167972 RepID=UPI002AA72E0F|nr:hypothetical protein [uncultured Enterococcus sp.]